MTMSHSDPQTNTGALPASIAPSNVKRKNIATVCVVLGLLGTCVGIFNIAGFAATQSPELRDQIVRSVPPEARGVYRETLAMQEQFSTLFLLTHGVHICVSISFIISGVFIFFDQTRSSGILALVCLVAIGFILFGRILLGGWVVFETLQIAESILPEGPFKIGYKGGACVGFAFSVAFQCLLIAFYAYASRVMQHCQDYVDAFAQKATADGVYEATVA